MSSNVTLKGKYLIETIHRKYTPTIYRALFVVEKRVRFLFWSWSSMKVFFISDAGGLYENDCFGIWNFDSYQKAALAIEKRSQIVKQALAFQKDEQSISSYEPHLK